MITDKFRNAKVGDTVTDLVTGKGTIIEVSYEGIGFVYVKSESGFLGWYTMRGRGVHDRLVTLTKFGTG